MSIGFGRSSWFACRPDTLRMFSQEFILTKSSDIRAKVLARIERFGCQEIVRYCELQSKGLRDYYSDHATMDSEIETVHLSPTIPRSIL